MDLNAARERLDAKHRQYLQEPIFDGSTVVFLLLILVVAFGAAVS